jgi:hypothetical protein
MTHEKMLRQQLNKAKAGGFQVSFGGWNLTLVADRCDSLSCAIKELALQRNTPIQEVLTSWAKRIAAQATGLLEPLRLVEADLALKSAVLRSTAPSVSEEVACYYELALHRADQTSVKLHRYAAHQKNGQKREAISFVLTHDTIVKLVMDIVGNN